MNRTLTDKAEAMQLDAYCPKSWWEFAFEMAVHVYNRTPLRRTRGKTPLENLTVIVALVACASTQRV